MKLFYTAASPFARKARAAAAEAGVERDVEAVEITQMTVPTNHIPELSRENPLGKVPVLQLADGRIQLLEKVRTASRAIARLEEIVAERAGESPVDIAVHHLAAADRAEALAERLRARVPGLARLYVSEVGAVIGAHTGPGLLGAVVSQC